MTNISSNLDKEIYKIHVIYLVLLIGLAWNLFDISFSVNHNCSLKIMLQVAQQFCYFS